MTREKVSPERWSDRFPGLSRLPVDQRAELEAKSAVVNLPAGSRIYGPGQAPSAYLLMLDGTVRVQQTSEGGREIVLYRVGEGESCALTTACLMSYENYLAEAVAETEIRAVAVPRALFDDFIARSPEFRRFVFTAFSALVTDLFRIIDEVAFSRIDIRLADKLLELARSGDTVAATQQQLAAELGTAREVVSRMLSEFQRRNWVAASRGSITLRDRTALQRLSSSK